MAPVWHLQASENWTRVTFTPDLAKFGMTELEADTVALMRKRVYDMAGILGKGVKVGCRHKRRQCLHLAPGYETIEWPQQRLGTRSAGGQWYITTAFCRGYTPRSLICSPGVVLLATGPGSALGSALVQVTDALFLL